MAYQAGLPLSNPPGLPLQILPEGGDCRYFGKIFTLPDAFRLFQKLLTVVPWKPDEVFLYGKRYVTARQVAWFGDSGISYSYSGSDHQQPLPWNSELLEIKKQVETRTDCQFNACLANLYRDGSEGMGWHQDDEKELGERAIASVSLGAERRFDFRHKATGNKQSIFLEQGSLLLMAGETQKHWQHQLPKSARVTTPRINLTFRKIIAR